MGLREDRTIRLSVADESLHGASRQLTPPIRRPPKSGARSAKKGTHRREVFFDPSRSGKFRELCRRYTYALDGNDQTGAIVVFVWTMVANRQIACKRDEPVTEAADWLRMRKRCSITHVS